jgi:NAD(P)-dependent dehydrogenase (short-subunit alcohol dehydrogenase family)
MSAEMDPLSPIRPGKVALITGAAGEMGLATAARFARAGARLCLVDAADADLARAAAVVAEAGAEAGGEAVTFAGDVADPEQCRAAVDAALAAFGRLDALCNFANAFFPARAGEMARAEFDRTLAVNMAAPFYLFQAAIPHLLESAGAVVFVSSAAATIAVANTVAYSASKAGVSHMTRVLAKEYMATPVRINAIEPGAVAVDLTPKTERAPGVDPRRMQQAIIPRGTLSLDKVADLVAFLALEEDHGFHGACIALDKGMALG